MATTDTSAPRALQINRMPNLTWHRLKMNWAEVELPACPPAPDAIDLSLPEGVQQAVPEAIDALVAKGTWEDGMGTEAAHWITEAAGVRTSVLVPADSRVSEPIELRVNAREGSCVAAALDIVVGPRAQVHMTIHVDSAEAGAGVAATNLRILAQEDARVRVDTVQTLAEGFTHLDNMGIVELGGARVVVNQTVLGAAQSYTGFAANLAGDESDCKVDTRYLGHGAQIIDFNYLIRQRGRNSNCEMVANGILTDNAQKTLRGTIDLIHGCSGSVGREQENVLLLNDKVDNKTVPIILCDEDDVQGAHGASIGHVNPEQLRYLHARGLTTSQIESLFASASFDYAASHAHNERVRDAVWRLGTQVLGDTYQPEESFAQEDK